MPCLLNQTTPTYRISLQRLSKLPALPVASIYCLVDAIAYIAHVIVADTGAGRQTDAHMEEFLAHSIDVGWRVLIHRLPVHRLPQGTALHLASVKIDAQSLHVIVGLAVGAHLATRVGHSCSAAHSTGMRSLPVPR